MHTVQHTTYKAWATANKQTLGRRNATSHSTGSFSFSFARYFSFSISLSLSFSFFLFLFLSLSFSFSLSLFRSLFEAFLDEAANLSRHKNPSRYRPLKRLSVPSHTVPHPSSRGELITAISVVSQGQQSLYSFRASAFYLYLPIRLT